MLLMPSQDFLNQRVLAVLLGISAGSGISPPFLCINRREMTTKILFLIIVK
jgi:hypothetical protein